MHAYSLIHDDLPALDDDDLRRGRPSNHLVHGEAMAILAGDALQSLAFESLSKAIPPSGPATAMAATLILSASIGARGMAGGQALDLRLEGQEVDLNTASSMEVLKTGYLISAAMAMGAALGGGSPEIVSMMIEAGLAAGLAFQIKDDLLNRQGDPALMGKRTGTDAARGKASVVAVVGEAAAAKLAAAYAKEAAAIIAPLGSAKLKRLLDLMVRRDR
jgi:geranylgeranyl pyrophosphate synthase